MGNLALSDKTLEKYLGYLKNLDNMTKKKLIDKLRRSLDRETEPDFDPNSLFGAWEDSRNSDEIIAEIRASRVETRNTEGLG